MKKIFSITIILFSFSSVFVFGKELIQLRDDISYKVTDQIQLRDQSLSGSELYQNYCSVCHSEKGNGASWTASSLTPSPANFSDPAVIKKLSRGRMFKSIRGGVKDTGMMAWHIQLTDKEINRVIDYIRTTFMKLSETTATEAEVGSGDFSNGKKLYQQNCVPCHGKKGDGNGPRAYFNRPKPRNFLEPGETADLKNTKIIFSAIKKGVPGSVMPTWGHVLSDKEIMDLAVYVQKAFIKNVFTSQPIQKKTEISYIAPIKPVTSVTDFLYNFAAGKDLYKARCAICHGENGDGNGTNAPFMKPQRPRNFIDPVEAIVLRNSNMLFLAIKNGVSNTVMHSWGHVMSDDDIMNIAHYVKEAFVKKAIPLLSGENKNISIAGLTGSFDSGKILYEQRCVPCHGIKGDGNGRRAYYLQPKPRNFLEPGETVNLQRREDIFKAIKIGIPETTMPGWGIVFADKEIMDMTVYIEQAFIKKKSKNY